MSRVPRHVFLPGVPLEAAYANDAVVTKTDAAGVALSSASQPSIVAAMLEQAAIEPGHRVLEIGAGTGYNAALLRTMGAVVTTVDIDPEVVTAATTALLATGNDDVRVVAGDGNNGDEAGAPYDRIIVTAGAWDLPPAWWRQLAVGGRLVVPLRWRGVTRSVAFRRDPGRMVSESTLMCGFIPMRGPAGDGEIVAAIGPDGDVTLHYDEDQHIDPGPLPGVWRLPAAEHWSGVTVSWRDPFDLIWLRLILTEPGACGIAAAPSALDSGLIRLALPYRSPAVTEHGSLAYLTMRPLGRDRFELGAVGHGDPALVARIGDQIRRWDHDRTCQPQVIAYPAGTPITPAESQALIVKRHIQLVLAAA